MEATTSACQAIWFANLVKELASQNIVPITLYVDKKWEITLMKNSVFHGRIITLTSVFHFIWECIEDGQSIIEHVSKDQRVDIFTKYLEQVKFSKMWNMLGVTDTELGPV